MSELNSFEINVLRLVWGREPVVVRTIGPFSVPLEKSVTLTLAAIDVRYLDSLAARGFLACSASGEYVLTDSGRAAINED